MADWTIAIALQTRLSAVLYSFLSICTSRRASKVLDQAVRPEGYREIPARRGTGLIRVMTPVNLPCLLSVRAEFFAQIVEQWTKPLTFGCLGACL